ncbi:MAG: pyridoxal phosphate-dependent aminotransferase, partial [Aquificae bacterium]|nr:pyridoxal phosphate-dependent aminotransferase [Aquificota bacterium]
PFIVMEILERAKELEREGRDVIHMEIGEPDLPPSPRVLEAVERFKDKARGYTHSLGIWELREAVAEYYLRRYGVEVDPERVVITTGTSGAFSLIFSALFEPGEAVAFTDPGYPCYPNFAKIYCLRPAAVPVGPETDYELRADLLEEATKREKNLKGFLVTSPSNPVGNVYSETTLRELAEFALERDLVFISDEIYHGLEYEKRASTALEFSDRAVVVGGFSKFFCMPGYRLGWAIVPKEWVRRLQVVAQNLFISPPTLSQLVAAEALRDESHQNFVRETFKKRRDFLYGELKELFEVPARPEGAFYVWAGVDRYGLGGFEFAKRLLEEAGVAVTPGVDFGRNDTEGFVRFAYASSLERLKEGVDRIKEFLKKL